MKITNIYNLPQALVDFATKQDEEHTTVENLYGVTSLLSGVRETLLKRRHRNEITQDISDMVWMIFGQAVHKIAEESGNKNDTEIGVEWKSNNIGIRGRIDYYNETLQAIEDYKTCSVWKYVYQDFDDWYKQGLMYAFILGKDKVKRLRFHCMFKDWKVGELRNAKYKGNSYPEHPMWTWEYEIKPSDYEFIEQFIKDRLLIIKNSVDLADDDLPLCTEQERWNNGDTYAVMKYGRKTALRVLDTKEEAEAWARDMGGDFIETRKGIDNKCLDYCVVKEFCNHYKKISGKDGN